MIFPFYNEEKTIGLTINSLRHQTMKVNEIIFVDSGSNDNTVEIIKYREDPYGSEVKNENWPAIQSNTYDSKIEIDFGPEKKILYKYQFLSFSIVTQKA